LIIVVVLPLKRPPVAGSTWALAQFSLPVTGVAAVGVDVVTDTLKLVPTYDSTIR
jgi:hypothetical protein